MLVWLAEYLVRYETAFNAISYITVRAILALLTALFYFFMDWSESDQTPSNLNLAKKCVMTVLKVTLRKKVRQPWAV